MYTSFQIPTCNSEGIICAQNVEIDKKICMVPCEGIYADIKKLPSDNVFAENDEMFKLRYKNYKSFFEKSKGAFISTNLLS